MDTSSITSWLSQLSAAQLQPLFAGRPECASGWVRVLALEGIAEAQVCYGRMLLEGTGQSKDQREAFTWFKRAASQGSLEAYNMVGRCLENGWGSQVNSSLAAAHYHKAADAGHVWAQYNLGHLYLDGIGVERDQYIAYRYYRCAAAQEHARAMNLVGRCCEEGWGTPQDFSAAAEWYRRSAEGGYFRGQYNWATILLKSGRAQEAALWFEKAATSGTSAVHEAVLQTAAVQASCEPMTALMHRLHSGNEGQRA